MGAISGDVNTNPMFCVNPADLSSRPTGSKQTGDLAYVTSLEGTAIGPYFFFKKDSVLPASNSVISPSGSSAGRWLSLAVYGMGSGSSLIAVAGSRLVLAAVDVSGYPNGTRGVAYDAANANVSDWELAPSTSFSNSDNIFQMNASDGRVWTRVIIPRRSDVQKNVWYINATTGSNLSAGGITTPIGSFKEWWCRTGGQYAQDTTLNISSATPAWPTGDGFIYSVTPVAGPSFNPMVDGGWRFAIVGTRFVVRSGTFTAAGVQGNFNAGTKSTATDVTSPLGAGDVGSMILVTGGGGSGNIAWVLADLGAGVVQTSFWVTQTGSATPTNGSPPANGATYSIVNMTQLIICQPVVNGSGLFSVVNIEPVATTNGFTNFTNNASNGMKTYWINVKLAFLSTVDNQFNYLNGGNFWNVMWDSFFRPKSGQYWINYGGTTQGSFMASCGSAMMRIEQFASTCPIQCGGSVGGAEFGGFLTINGSGIWTANSNGLVVARGGQVYVVGLGGTGNLVGVLIRDGGTIYVINTIVPTITGATELSFATANLIPPFVAGAAVGANYASNPCTTWAQWAAAPFNRDARHQQDYASIINATAI